MTTQISEKEKIFGFQENNEISFIINMLIINTKTVIYMKRPEGKSLGIHGVLKSNYNEMIADEYICEVYQKKIGLFV